MTAFIPAVLMPFAANSYSPEVWRIAEEGHAIRAVEVEKVLSSQTIRGNTRGTDRDFSVWVQVSVPFDAGSRVVKGHIHAEEAVERGDRAWVLFAPSTSEVGGLVEDEREQLAKLVGGPTETGLRLLALGLAGVCLVWVLLMYRTGDSGDPLGPILRGNRSRLLPCTVVGGGVRLGHDPEHWTNDGKSREGPTPCLRLDGPSGVGVDLFVAHVIDPGALDQCLAGAKGTLHWATGASGPGTPGRSAVLVLEDGRYIRGRAKGSDGSELPEGKVPAADELPQGRRLRAFRPYPIFTPGVHSIGLWTLAVGLLALILVEIGVGTVATVVCGVVAALAPTIATVLVILRRTRYLRSLLPGLTPTADSVA